MTRTLANPDTPSADAPTRAPGVEACSHCGLPVPSGLLDPDRAEQFCCAGCETVWKVLRGARLEGYYAVRDAADADARRPSTSGESFEEFADPAYQRAFVKGAPGGLCESEFLLEGVHCAACVWLLERLPRVAPGVVESRVGLRSGIVTVRYRPDVIELPEIARRLDRLGYRPHPARGGAARDARSRADRASLVRVAVAGACAGNVMLLATALYSGAISGIDPFWESLFRWLSMGLAVVSLAWPGRVFFRGALAALRTRTAHLDLPIALALAAGGAWGVVNTIRGSGEIYFDSLTVLVFLLLVGRWVQHRQQRAAIDSVELMLSLTPSSATRIGAGGEAARVPIDSLEVGNLVEVRAGDAIPADGSIEWGESSVDESLLTGEPMPRPVTPGETVSAGSINCAAPVRVRIGAVGRETRIGRLMARVAETGARRAPIVRRADAIAGWFVVCVLALAGATLLFWWRAGAHVALEHATALAIVACPCALGLATPLAMAVSVGRAARRGALIKDAAAIEALARPGVLVLDKTGTITEGRPTLVDWHGDPAALPALGALERGSSHPLARALAEHAGERLVVEGHEHITGAGVRGNVSGEMMAAGTSEFLMSLGIDIGPRWEALGAQAATAGRTPILVARDAQVVALAEIGDAIRADARSAIEELQQTGWDVRVLSGDRQRVVDAVCREIGIDGAGIGDATPEQKAAAIESLRADGARVVMVGDGVNDTAAMASATLGIAVHGGAEASLEAADVYLTRQGLEPLVDLAAHSRRTMGRIRLVLGVSIAYNAIAAGLAMGGLMSALFAAVLMPTSSLAVVAIALGAGGGRRSR